MQNFLARLPWQSVTRLLRALPSRRTWQLVVCVLLILCSAASEVIALGLVVPLLATLADPQLLFDSAFGRTLANLLHIDEPRGLLWPIVAAFIVAAVVAGAIRIIVLWANTRLVNAIGADLGTEAFSRILHQQFEFHLAQNSGDVSASITRKVDAVVSGLLQPLLSLLSSVVLTVAILIALLWINTVIALTAFVAFGVGYLLLALLSRRAIATAGGDVAANYPRVTRAVQEGLKGIREVLLSGNQAKYLETFRAADRPLRRAQGTIVVISQSARFVMEAFGMAVIAGLAAVFVMSAQQGPATIATLGALALGGQRLLPMLQQSFASWASIAAYRSVLDDVLAILELPMMQDDVAQRVRILPFEKQLEFRDVHFRYQTGDDWVLRGLNFTVPRGARVGLVGTTGGGKTTTTDLFMGLLFPTSGTIAVDGIPIDRSVVQAWRQRVTHVPQVIYLMDGTFAENIALGEAGPVDMDRVRRSARLAQIDEFIASQPGHYDARIGEDGAWLSGGQRQRLGIARALYKRADVLVLDEATSALDTQTEASVMEEISALDRDMTVLLVAHRLTTLEKCDLIIRIEGGRIFAVGSYAEVIGTGPAPGRA